MPASLAYRKNEQAILRGDVPQKYLRLLPYIPGDRILEIGSAEGVLSMLLARADRGNKRAVTALEMRADRHADAIKLRDAWLQQFRFGRDHELQHVNGAINDRLELLEGVDTLVAVRMIYYLRDTLDEVFAAVASKVPNVVLCGNGNRARDYHAGVPDKPGGPHNFYASAEGMTALLTRHGYEIASTLADGDPIVVGRKDV